MDQATPTDVMRIKDLVDSAKEILILTHNNPDADSLGSSLALYIALKNAGKHVVVGCPTPMTVEYSHFIGANKVETTFSKKNFVISLDYEDGSIDKVTYNIEGKKFNLVIEPRPGFENFNEDHVSFHHQGTAADVIFTIDTMHLGELGELYEGEKELFATRPIINIDKHIDNAKYGVVNVIDHAATTAELVGTVLSEIGMSLTEDVAINLLNAIYLGTDNFQKEVIPRTFELAAACVKAGGKRFIPSVVPQQAEEEKQEETKKEQTAPVEEKKEEEKPPEPEQKKEQSQPQNPPEDWLKPKIFKSSTIA